MVDYLKKIKSTGETWGQNLLQMIFIKKILLITDEERKILSDLSKKRDEEFLQGNNVQTINGVRMIEIQGKLYKID
jgi:hypothetical protein